MLGTSIRRKGNLLISAFRGDTIIPFRAGEESASITSRFPLLREYGRRRAVVGVKKEGVERKKRENERGSRRTRLPSFYMRAYARAHVICNPASVQRALLARYTYFPRAIIECNLFIWRGCLQARELDTGDSVGFCAPRRGERPEDGRG